MPNEAKFKRIDELSLMYVDNPYARDFEEDLISFRDDVASDMASSTKKYKFRVTFRYLKVNDIEFDEQWMRNIIGPGMPVTKEVVPNPQELREIVYHLPPHRKGIVLVMTGGGTRIDEALNICIKWIRIRYGFAARARLKAT